MTSILPLSGPAPASAAANPAATTRKRDDVQSMAVDFEAIFVRQMLSTMRSSSLGEGLFEGQGMQQFRDMQDAKIAESLAQRGVFGIAQMLARHVENKDV